MQNRFINSYIFSLLCCLLCLFSCKQDFSPQDTKSLQLTAEYVEVTEAWLKLSVLPPDSRSTYIVKRDTHIVFSGKLDIADTIIHDRNLEPNKDYAYRAWREVNGEKTGSTARLNITTMDTTSHNFSWQTYEFGAKSSSVFYDVAIINENDIWAVGKIFTEDTYTYDSLGNWIEPYNAAHWDGQKWELKRIKTNACGGVDYPAIKAIFSFSSKDILFAHIDGSITHFDGNKFINDCSLIYGLNGSANKMWGLSKNDLFVVSGNGFIAHYDGQGWQKIESGTNTTIQDIWGAKNSQTGECEIICAASPGYGASNSGLYRINEDHKVEALPWVAGRAARSIWFNNSSNIFTCGSGVFKRELNGYWKELAGTDILSVSTERVRGIADNDLFIVGHFGSVMHFNGKNFKVYPKLSSGIYYSCDYKKKMMLAVGFNNIAGFILMMWK